MKFLLSILIFIIPFYIVGQNTNIFEPDSGILELNFVTFQEEVEIYNSDRTVWMNFCVNDHKAQLMDRSGYSFWDIEETYRRNKNFNPYKQIISCGKLMFQCTGIESGFYKVVVNEKTGLEKFIKIESQWVFKKWPEHLLTSVY